MSNIPERQHRWLEAFTPDQKRVLLVLTLINFVNWIDRQIVYPLFPLIKDDFHLTYAQLGWLVAAFSIVHALGSLGLGRLADLTSRKKVISYGIAFWSAATFMSGVAGSFRSLLACRATVGVGEAAYAPAGNAMISAAFPKSVRARVQGVFDLGMFTGGALGLALGAILAQSVGWRPAFFIVGIPGVLLALSVRGLPEQSQGANSERVSMRELARVPAYLFVLASGWFIAFAGYTYVIWGAEFVYRYKGFSLRQAGILLGSIMVVAGILGVVTGACVADRLAKRFAWGRALTPAIGFLVSAPLILGALHSGSKLVVLCLFFTGTFFMTWYHGPVTAVIHDLTPPRAHASAIGAYYFFVNFFATTAASVLVGKVADGYGLLAGMHCAVIAQVVGGMGFFAVIHSIRRHGLAHSPVSRRDKSPGPPESLELERLEEAPPTEAVDLVGSGRVLVGSEPFCKRTLPGLQSPRSRAFTGKLPRIHPQAAQAAASIQLAARCGSDGATRGIAMYSERARGGAGIGRTGISQRTKTPEVFHGAVSEPA